MVVALIFSFIGNAFMLFFTSFLYWLSIFFVLPFKELEILWILIPIWINLFFTDFFQEKRGTSMGNAITNGAVILWVGVDWVRYLIRYVTENRLAFSTSLFVQFLICLIVIVLGFLVIYTGIKGNKIITKIARVRETSYLMLIFSPIIYGVTLLTWKYLLISIIFFPFFYFVIEMIFEKIPSPIMEEKINTSSLYEDTSTK